MLFIEKISRMSKSGCDNKELLDYAYENYNEIECAFNGHEYKEPKKRNNNLCIDCNMEKIIDYEKSTLVCMNCGSCEFNHIYVSSYNHTMQPLRSKCVYKTSDNFKVIVRQFFYGGKLVPDDIMQTIRDEIHDKTNILYNYTIHILISILECILKRKELMMYKGSL